MFSGRSSAGRSAALLTVDRAILIFVRRVEDLVKALAGGLERLARLLPLPCPHGRAASRTGSEDLGLHRPKQLDQSAHRE